MPFRSGQYYMNFINTLKLFTANIRSFDMKSNCTNLRGGPLGILGGGRKISPARIFLFSWKLCPNFFFIV